MSYDTSKLTNLGQMKTLLQTIKSRVDNKILFAENVTIGSNAWTSSGDSTFPYKATFTMTGITTNYLPVIEFRDSDVMDYDFAPYATTGSNSITIYCKTSPSTTIILTTVVCYHGTRVTVAPVGI